MFYALSQHEKEIYKDKINLFVALAPVTRLKGAMQGMLGLLGHAQPVLD
jgi:hypothetical protein